VSKSYAYSMSEFERAGVKGVVEVVHFAYDYTGIYGAVTLNDDGWLSISTRPIFTPPVDNEYAKFGYKFWWYPLDNLEFPFGGIPRR
jgi:hypothetical protein